MKSCEYPECCCDPERAKECNRSRYAILDLPLPLEPVEVDLSIPLEKQLPPGLYLEAAKKMIGRSK